MIAFTNRAFMMNTNVITMQNIILFKCMIFLQLLKDYFLVVLSCFSWAIEVTSMLLLKKIQSNQKLKQIGHFGFFIS